MLTVFGNRHESELDKTLTDVFYRLVAHWNRPGSDVAATVAARIGYPAEHTLNQECKETGWAYRLTCRMPSVGHITIFFPHEQNGMLLYATELTTPRELERVRLKILEILMDCFHESPPMFEEIL